MDFSGLNADNVLNLSIAEMNRIIKPIFTDPVWSDMTESDKLYQRIRFIAYIKNENVRNQWPLDVYLLDIIPPVVIGSNVDDNLDGEIVMTIYPTESNDGHDGSENSEVEEEANTANPAYNNKAGFTIYVHPPETDEDGEISEV